MYRTVVGLNHFQKPRVMFGLVHHSSSNYITLHYITLHYITTYEKLMSLKKVVNLDMLNVKGVSFAQVRMSLELCHAEMQANIQISFLYV